MAGTADLFAAAPPTLTAAHAWIGDALCVRLPGVPSRELNRVIGPLDHADLPAVLEFFDGGPFIVCGGECPEGFEPGYAWMIFEREADPAATAPTALRLEVVGADRGEDFARPVVVAFGMPESFLPWLATLPGRQGWSCLVAYAEGDAAVGAGALFVDGDEGWLGFGATLPEARGQGAQSAILARRIALAAEQGATLVTTETGVMEEGRPARSYRNILRAGFREAGTRPNWDAPGSTWS